ncbi:MAG: helix-turn-helix domain-containing protein [Bacteroidota bacterium]
MERLVFLTESQLEEIVHKTVEKAVQGDNFKKEKGANDEWLTNKRVCEMLSLTPKTMQNYRDEGKIPFAKVGSRIFYRKRDIDTLLESNFHEAFASGRRSKCQI